MRFDGMAAPLTSNALEFATDTLKADAPSIWAVLSVETSGAGYLADRRIKILFERHVFHARTGGEYDDHPDLSNAERGGYGASGAWQYERLAKAMSLDAGAALESASWGLGQVMGFNAARVGHASAARMVEAFRDSEDAQLSAMLSFVANAGLADALRRHDWTAFARGYNGEDFHKNGYDEKLAYYHTRFKVGPLPDLLVRWTQMALTFRGVPDVGGVDGWFGDHTHNALLLFQRQAGIPETGAPDARTVERLAQGLNWASPL